jgi:hypothetical protein
MGRLQTWWQRLTEARAETVRKSTPKPVPVAIAKTDDPSQLEIVDSVDPKKRPGRVGEVGFDPYSSDAGYAKPHSWERIDHD